MADAKVQDSLKKYVLLKMDMTETGSPAGKIAKKYGISTIPDLRVLSSDGQTKKEIRARKAADLAKELDAAAK